MGVNCRGWRGWTNHFEQLIEGSYSFTNWIVVFSQCLAILDIIELLIKIFCDTLQGFTMDAPPPYLRTYIRTFIGWQKCLSFHKLQKGYHNTIIDLIVTKTNPTKYVISSSIYIYLSRCTYIDMPRDLSSYAIRSLLYRTPPPTTHPTKKVVNYLIHFLSSTFCYLAIL